jgi:hypothetical protein
MNAPSNPKSTVFSPEKIQFLSVEVSRDSGRKLIAQARKAGFEVDAAVDEAFSSFSPPRHWEYRRLCALAFGLSKIGLLAGDPMADIAAPLIKYGFGALHPMLALACLADSSVAHRLSSYHAPRWELVAYHPPIDTGVEPGSFLTVRRDGNGSTTVTLEPAAPKQSHFESIVWLVGVDPNV